MKKINNKYKLFVFKSKFNKDYELRVFNNGWFFATEIAKILEYKQFDNNSIARIVEDRNKKYYKDTDFYSSIAGFKNLPPNTILITKDGIINIISRSRSKNVKTFKEWINKDVFPSLKDTEVIQKKEEIQAQFI